MADWPASLPKPLLSGFSGNFGNMVQRTDFDSGPARQRRKFVNAPDDVQVSWRLSAAQMQIFRDFLKNTIFGGAAYFNMALNIGSGWLIYEVRFSAAPDYQYLNPLWQVNGKLDVRLP